MGWGPRVVETPPGLGQPQHKVAWGCVPSPQHLSWGWSPGSCPPPPMVVSLPTQFILKHTKYQHLREVERFPNSFNPHVPDTLALLKVILSQVMEKHRRSSWIHIGADEVGRGFI